MLDGEKKRVHPPVRLNFPAHVFSFSFAPRHLSSFPSPYLLLLKLGECCGTTLTQT